MVEINWTEQALNDLNDIGEYISKDSVRYAEATVQHLFEATNILEKHQHIGKIVAEFNVDSIREIVKGNYRVVYRIVSPEQIDILTVHHSKRLMKNNPNLKDLFED